MIPNQIYALITASIIALSIITAQYIKIQHLNTDIANLNTTIAYKDLTIEKLENSNLDLTQSINKSNENLSKITVDLDKARQALDEWRRKPPEIRYEVIYKIREAKSNDCSTTKDVINSIRNLDYSRM